MDNKTFQKYTRRLEAVHKLFYVMASDKRLRGMVIRVIENDVSVVDSDNNTHVTILTENKSWGGSRKKIVFERYDGIGSEDLEEYLLTMFQLIKNFDKVALEVYKYIEDYKKEVEVEHEKKINKIEKYQKLLKEWDAEILAGALKE